MTLKSICTFILGIVIFSSCSHDPLDIDASDIKVDIKFYNVDSSFVHADSAQIISLHNKYKNEIGNIYDYELGYCLGIGNVSDTAFYRSFTAFLNDEYVKRVSQRIEEKFSNLTTQKKEIEDGFKRIKFHIPNGKIPKSIVFMNSFYASNAFCTETEIGIGLERYLGKETDVIQELPADQFYEWMKEGLDEKYLTRDAICAWVMTHYVEEVEGNLVEEMINWGKILYLTQAAFPDKDIAHVLRYSTEEFQWAVDNEYQHWKYLVDEKMLFKTDERIKTNLLNDAPFTAGFPEKGPDRLGQFFGLRMVQKYIEIKEISVKELINTPYTAILAEYEID
jgi:hypothetical protein